MASAVSKAFLIGCVVIVAAGILVVAGGGLYVRHKFHEWIGGAQDQAKQDEQLSKHYPFPPPPDGVIAENQLQRFLAVRKQIYAVYERYEPQFKNLDQNKKRDLSVISKGWSMWKELRQEHTKALAAQKMSPEEYQYILNAVYKTWAAVGTKEALKNQSFADMGEKGLKEAIDRIDLQLKDPQTSEPAKKALQKTREELQKQLDHIDQNSAVKQLDETLDSVPAENVALFRKYEREIKKYSMSGLELVGL
jgi:hypothetical protein